MAEAPRPVVPDREVDPDRSAWLLQTLNDGLGDRYLTFDDAGAMLESVRIRADLSAAPDFGAAVRRRARQLDGLASPWLAAIRTVDVDAHGVTVRAEAADVTRLGEVLASVRCDSPTALAILEQALFCAATLHRVGPDVAHGAITIDRLGLTTRGHLRLLDCAFGSALAASALDAETRFRELGIIAAACDRPADVMQCAIVALELLRQRPLTPVEVREGGRTIADTAGIPGPAVAAWFRRALAVDGERFTDAQQALSALEPLLPGTTATRAALVAALAGREPVAEAIDAVRTAEREPDRASVLQPPVTATPDAAADDLSASRDVVSTPNVIHDGAPRAARARRLAVPVALALLAALVVLQAIYIARQRTPVAITLTAPAPSAPVVLPPPALPQEPQASTSTPAVAREVAQVPAAPAGTAGVRPATVGAGWLSIRAPFELDIFRDGQLVGTSRSPRIMLPDGRHSLVLVNETFGFRRTEDVTVTAGRASVLDVAVPDGVLNVNAVPWATVTIDGRSVGETPLGNLALPLGQHEVVFQHPELGERRQTVVITSGAPARVSVDFRK